MRELLQKKLTMAHSITGGCRQTPFEVKGSSPLSVGCGRWREELRPSSYLNATRLLGQVRHAEIQMLCMICSASFLKCFLNPPQAAQFAIAHQPLAVSCMIVSIQAGIRLGMQIARLHRSRQLLSDTSPLPQDAMLAEFN